MELFINYIDLALRTESTRNPLTQEVIDLGLSGRTLHSIIGIAGEIDELSTAVNKNDKVNALEELGDILWYLAILQSELDFISNHTLVKDMTLKYNLDGLDLTKKTMFYGKPLDKVAICNYAMSIYLLVNNSIKKYGSNMGTVLDTNINKLKIRYPDKFDDIKSIERDLVTERKVLEEGLDNDKE